MLSWIWRQTLGHVEWGCVVSSHREGVCIKGDVIFAASPSAFDVHENSWLVTHEGGVVGIYENLPDAYSVSGYEQIDRSGRLIIPGFVDLHMHAPQLMQVGMGMDEQLLDWLEGYTFDTEAKFADAAYAEPAYGAFVDELASCGTTRSAVFGTIHAQSNQILAEKLRAKGLGAYVGKVNMDSNTSSALTETTERSLAETEEFIKSFERSDDRLVRPIITPRFALSCSAELMKGLGELAEKYDVPVQSHLSENTDEVARAKELFSEYDYYYQVYEAFGLFGSTPTAMAHCIHLSDGEIAALAESGVVAVHCPLSNLNLASGLMRTRKMMDVGVRIGLGSDVGAGNTLFMPQVIVSAVQTSKVVSAQNEGERQLALSEAFWLATKGGGSFFGQVGSFEEGYEADVLVVSTPERIDDKSAKQRLEWFLYNGGANNIEDVFVAGTRVDN